MTQELADDRIGVMWLRAHMAGDTEDAAMIQGLAKDQIHLLKAALGCAIKVMQESPAAPHLLNDVTRHLLYFALVDDALDEGAE